MTLAAPPWTTESELAQSSAAIDANWARGQSLSFTGVAGVHIEAVSVPAVPDTDSAPPILMLPGRTEALVKYRELTLDLNRRGHPVYLMDHRGQGQSGRLLDDPERGHVEAFSHYVDDVLTFIDTQLTGQSERRPVLFAHSMGGCIAGRVLQRRVDAFAAAVLFAPMFEIQTGAIPGWVARTLIRSLAALPVGEGGEGYVPGGGGFADMPFEDGGVINPLTHSEVRFKRLMADYAEFPETRLGSPTRRWFELAQQAMAEAVQDSALVQTPTLLFNAADDPIVGANGQHAFCAGNPLIEGPRVVPGARHELLMESDAIRSVVLDEAMAFVADALSD